MPSLNLITTTAGRAAINAALAGPTTITVVDAQLSDTHQAVGVGTTALTNVVRTISAVGSVRPAGSEFALHVVLLDDGATAYDVRALSLRLTDGTYLMVYSQAGVIVSKAASASLHFAIDLIIDNDTATAVTFGDTDYVLPMSGETAPGLIELATSAEVIAGTDAVRAVTPAGLAARTATDTRRGIVELATDAETLTGTDTERAVTPASLLARVGTLKDLLAFTGDSYDWGGAHRFNGSSINNLRFSPTRTWNRALPILTACVAFSGVANWEFSQAGFAYSVANNEPLMIPLNGVVTDWSFITSVRVRVRPGTARSGTDRMRADLVSVQEFSAPSIESASVYDDGTTNDQEIVLAAPSTNFSASSNVWYVRVYSGVTAGSDRCYSPEVFFTIDQIIG